jgi:hypothetical protein
MRRLAAKETRTAEKQMIDPPPLLQLACGIVGAFIANYFFGFDYLFEIVGFVVGVIAAVLIYAYFRPPGS